MLVNKVFVSLVTDLSGSVFVVNKQTCGFDQSKINYSPKQRVIYNIQSNYSKRRLCTSLLTYFFLPYV